MAQKWQSLAELQQLQISVEEVEEAEEAEEETEPEAEPPETINETGREAIALLKRWRAHVNDAGAAVATLIAVFGRDNGQLGHKVARWSPLPADVWLAEIAYQNGARLADMGIEQVLRSPAAAAMIKHRVEPGTRLKSMAFQTHAALLGYWREQREFLHVLRAFDRGKKVNAHELGLRVRSVELLVRQLEETNVRIMVGGHHG